MEAQGGFRSHRRCSELWLMLRGVCKISHLAFMDVSKAYDCVEVGVVV